MKKYFLGIFCTYIFCVGALSAQINSDKVLSWAAPAGEAASSDYTVTADHESIFVYSSNQYLSGSGTSIKGRSVSPVSFCTFDLINGPIDITVTIANSSLNRNSVKIVPKALGLSATVTNNEFTFTVSQPGQITILPGGVYEHPLHIYINSPEENVPSPSDPGVIYYGPGHHFVKLIDLDSNATLYLAGGAILEAEPLTVAEMDANPEFKSFPTNGINMQIGPFIQSKWKDNVKIQGRGIIRLAKSLQNNQRRRPIILTGCTNVAVEGVIIQESTAWNLYAVKCSDLTIDNVKIVSFFNNSDGICVAGCINAVVQNSFIHNSDDAFEIKGFSTHMYNVVYNNNIAWTTVGTAFGLSSETVFPVSNIQFTNSTVLFAKSQNGVRGAIGLHAQDHLAGANNASVRDILFENIVIEKMDGPLNAPIKVFNNWNYWDINHLTESGNPYQLQNESATIKPSPVMDNIVFRNIEVISSVNDDVVIMGDESNSMITNVTFDNVVINGDTLVFGDSRLKSNEYTSNIILLNSVKPTGLDDVLEDKVEIKVYPNPVQDTLYINSTSKIKSIYIYNLQGTKPKYKGNIDNYQTQISIRDLKSGIYLLTALGYKGERYTVKFIK